MHKEYILLNGFRKAKKGFTAGFHVPLKSFENVQFMHFLCDVLQPLAHLILAFQTDQLTPSEFCRCSCQLIC